MGRHSSSLKTVWSSNKWVSWRRRIINKIDDWTATHRSFSFLRIELTNNFFDFLLFFLSWWLLLWLWQWASCYYWWSKVSSTALVYLTRPSFRFRMLDKLFYLFSWDLWKTNLLSKLFSCWWLNKVKWWLVLGLLHELLLWLLNEMSVLFVFCLSSLRFDNRFMGLS